MPTQWGPLGMAGLEAGGQAVGGLLGMVLGGINDRRQIRQQQKLTDMQLNANQRMADYNQSLAYDMWQKTNYSAQKEQLNKAGLNPALLYGMGGAGGATTSGGQGSGVSGAQAPSGGGEIMAMMNQRAQLEMMAAQKRNIDANTKKTEAETPNVGLTGENIKADTGLKILQGEMQRIQNSIANATMENAINKVQIEMQKLDQEWKKAVTDQKINEETYQTQINQAKETLALTIAEKSLKESNIKVNDEQIKKLAEEITQIHKENNWIDIKAEDIHGETMMRIKKLMNDINMNDTPESWKQIYNIFGNMSRALTPKK